MDSVFQIKGQVRSDEKVDPTDIVKTKKALAEFGYYATPDYGIKAFTDDDMFRAMRSFQAEHNLKADTRMFPGSETERTIREALRRKRSGDKAAIARYRRLPQIHDPVGLGIERDDFAGSGFFGGPHATRRLIRKKRRTKNPTSRNSAPCI